MDHDRYDWSALPGRPAVTWPGEARVALMVVVSLQWFPLDMPALPFRPVGALDEPYPDYRAYSHRDYGNRVGIFRIMAVLDRLGIRATAAVNAAIAERYPALLAEVGSRGWEVAAHGLDMGRLHHAGLDRAEEAAMIDHALTVLRRVTGRPVSGWLSPGGSESLHTLDLLAERDVAYVFDWVNDDLPYPLRTVRGRLHAMPYSHEISDATIIWQCHQSTREFAEAVEDQFAALDREAERSGGRILAVSLHPWIIGQPHRIGALERALGRVAHQSGVWRATASEILAAFTAQEGPPVRVVQ